MKSYTKIPKDSWRICETIVLRYPEQKKEYADMKEQLLEATPYNDGQPRSNFPSNRVENAIVKLSSNRMLRIDRENKIVEAALARLDEEQQKVIRVRYWNETGKVIPYLKIREVGMSEASMKRAVGRFMFFIARKLGEID